MNRTNLRKRAQNGRRGSFRDGFQNFEARLGLGTGNLADGSQYGFNFITRQRQQLEAMYRGSWLIGAAVDAPSEDMTRAGIDIQSKLSPDDTVKLENALNEKVWPQLTNSLRWARLFGGSLALILIEGQDFSQPLRLETITPGSFKGIVALDRWMVQPSLGDVITELGPDLGLPKYYDVVAGHDFLPNVRVHHSRVIRFEGLSLPYFQRQAENLWGESVVERIFDRLVAFDSATAGASQLLYRSYLRILKIKGYRRILAEGPQEAYTGLIKQIEHMRTMQSNEGLSVMDSDDDMEGLSYSFGGVSDVLIQMGQQISGAVEVPLVRLFGQSPTGLDSSGESDLRTYYDGIAKKQNTTLRLPVQFILKLLCLSELGIKKPDDMSFDFSSLWLLPDEDKTNIANTTTQAISAAYESGLVTKETALKELRQTSRVTGLWSSITDGDIADAKDEMPPNAEGALPPPAGPDAPQGPKQLGSPVSRLGLPKPPDGDKSLEQLRSGDLTNDSADDLITIGDVQPSSPDELVVQGFHCVIETSKGQTRSGSDPDTGETWSVVMPDHYGYIRGTASAEGPNEGLDVFISEFYQDRPDAPIFIIHQQNPKTGEYDEDKVMLGYSSRLNAVSSYTSAFSDGKGMDRIQSIEKVTPDDLQSRLLPAGHPPADH